MAKQGSFATDAVRLTASKIIGNVLTLVSAMLLARIRTLEENGIYSELMLVISLAAAIFMLGLPNAINFFLAKAETREEKNRFLSFYYTLSTLLSAALGVTLCALTPVWVRYFNDPKLSQFLFFLLLFPWERMIISSVENVLVVLGRTRMLLYYRISNSVFLLLIIFYVWITHSSFMTYMILLVIVDGVYAVAVYVLAARYTGRLHFSLDREMIRRVLAFSLPLGLAAIVGTLNIEIDKLMLGHLLSTADLAIYANAAKELPLTIVATSLTAVLMPKMVRLFQQQKNEEAVAIWRDVTTISYAIMAFFAIGMAAFSTEAMVILYSGKYAPGGPVFAVYSLGLLLRCTYFGIVLNTTGRTKTILLCSVGSLLLNAALNYLLYLLLGVIGPAIATLLATLIMGLLQLVMSSRQLQIPFRHIFPWRSMAVLTLVNLTLGAVFLFIHRTVFPGEWQAVVLAAAWGLVYAAVLYRPGRIYWQKLRKE